MSVGTCVDNPRLGIIGCGATYSGGRQHCVANADWSEHPDGKAHITGALTTIDACWRHGRLVHPAERGFVELAPGRWGTPGGYRTEDGES